MSKRWAASQLGPEIWNACTLYAVRIRSSSEKKPISTRDPLTLMPTRIFPEAISAGFGIGAGLMVATSKDSLAGVCANAAAQTENRTTTENFMGIFYCSVKWDRPPGLSDRTGEDACATA